MKSNPPCIAIVISIFVCFLSSSFVVGNGQKIVMPWACLEICGDDIRNDFQQIQEHAPLPIGDGSLTSISYEMYQLGSDSTLIALNLTDVTSLALNDWKMGAFPMIISVNISNLRSLWSNPQPFIDSAINEASKYSFSGFNIDFEPRYGPES
jgi:hypothetical protein